MKIAHEAPLSAMKYVQERTSMDYALIHLFEKYPEYRQFFVDSLKQGREVILDNSIFELGEAFDMDKFYIEVCKLLPTAYIIPDVLEDYNKTKANIAKWFWEYPNAPGKSIGVVQGKTFDELVDCYKFIDASCDIIAISFDYSYYLETIPESIGTLEQRYSRGRVKFIQDLVRAGVINHSKWHHLLGTFTPQEMSAYSSYKFIRSVDTSNPIIHAIKGVKYTQWGLTTKEKMKMCDMMETPFEEIDQEILRHNISLFKEFCS